MPLTQLKTLKSGTLLGRWYLTESVAQLLVHPDLPNQIQLPGTITHEKRKVEWLASRLLAYHMLQQFTSDFYPLLNSDTGQPYFVGSPFHLSISHTQNQVAVLISRDYRVGIDIERIQSKVSRIQDKFLNLKEKEAFNNDLEKLTIAWSAKETLYKLYGKRNLIFNENLLLQPFISGKSGEIETSIHTPSLQEKFTVYFEIENETVLTYCLGN